MTLPNHSLHRQRGSHAQQSSAKNRITSSTRIPRTRHNDRSTTRLHQTTRHILG